MSVEETLVFTEYDLGDGLLFRSGRLPSGAGFAVSRCDRRNPRTSSAYPLKAP